MVNIFRAARVLEHARSGLERDTLGPQKVVRHRGGAAARLAIRAARVTWNSRVRGCWAALGIGDCEMTADLPDRFRPGGPEFAKNSYAGSSGDVRTSFSGIHCGSVKLAV